MVSKRLVITDRFGDVLSCADCNGIISIEVGSESVVLQAEDAVRIRDWLNAATPTTHDDYGAQVGKAPHWRPIETAPHEVRIMFFGGYEGRKPFMSIGFYCPTCPVDHHLRYIGEGMHAGSGYAATHWMPLPPLPTTPPDSGAVDEHGTEL